MNEMRGEQTKCLVYRLIGSCEIKNDFCKQDRVTAHMPACAVGSLAFVVPAAAHNRRPIAMHLLSHSQESCSFNNVIQSVYHEVPANRNLAEKCMASPKQVLHK